MASFDKGFVNSSLSLQLLNESLGVTEGTRNEPANTIPR